MFLIVGLGNPGREYANTRHNIGFRIVDRLSDAHGIDLDGLGAQSRWGRGRIAGRDVVLAQPQTYVNQSGRAVMELMAFFSVSAGSLIVVHDDCDLPPGRIRIRPGGGSGGHRGVESIIDHIGTSDFLRLRLGVGRPARGGLRDYVLSPFLPEEEALVDDMLKRGGAAVETILAEGVEAAMNRFNA